ncbi:TIGR03085 family metal-binding protein [Nocardia sp. NPDC057353]|uniref:TIGR03085 family metal-binding protein n=1 Tax=Nocardia sp. NPDC057353 TaxID=3346104 RepID=UPI00363D9D1C
MSMAQKERRELVATMAAAGPDAPTLCGSWTVRDLAAHLVVRERRPDAAPGIMIAALAPRLEKIQARAAERPFPELLEAVRTGPPWWSPLKPIDAVANLAEYFVHHEDVRRGSDPWEPRELPADEQRQLWKTVRRMAKMAYRKSPVPIVLRTPDGDEARLGSGPGEPVVLLGAPAELLLHAFGRDKVRIETSGPEDSVRQVLALDRSL